VEQDALQLSLFDTRNLAEIRSPEFPGERLIACYNSLLADERERKRNELLEATEQALEKIKKEVERRTKKPLTEGAIGKKVGARIGRFKMARHFELEIADGHFHYQRNQANIDREAALDGIYVIRTSEPRRALSAENVVRRYKSLAQLERVTDQGSPVHSFNTLMAELATRCRHRCRLGLDRKAPAIYQDTQPTPLQAHARELLRTFPVQAK
jgi:hypothetical protein